MKGWTKRSVRRRYVSGSILFAAFLLAGVQCSRNPLPPPRTASNISLVKYMGVWHEIARLPFPFEEDCYGSSAKYELVENDKFLITNYCWYKSFFGPMRRSQAEAWITEPAEPSKVKVSFFWPIFQDYWIIHVDKGYRHALVGTPDRKYMWILSRTVRLDDAVYQELLETARREGYDVSRIIRSPQRDVSPDLEQGAETQERTAADAGVDAGGSHSTSPEAGKEAVE